MSRSMGELSDDLRRVLRKLRAVEDRDQRTALLKRAAEIAVDLREHYIVPDTGRPDWGGKSWLYRDKIRQVYSEAGYPSDEAKKIQPIVRFHVGNIVRDRVPAEEREEAGLTGPSPRQRVKAGRDERAEIVRRARELESEPDLIRALSATTAIMERIDLERLAALSAKDRRLARGVLARARRRLDALDDALAVSK